ncbi:helix-turn-helix domain-containing protein [Actinomadura graeca]|uniref:Helix-turn-helix domain-containing protein n=1 Tax=Actinomadura graeca TaxID=2750812 RepID=A0ABX8QZH6_9ACTN|nr:helix-turn-helix domain-containing protein [Actinomadura graeca]QXJ24137.1 helix-turn-helix domain-containing protein [Actinomadura graeca]
MKDDAEPVILDDPGRIKALSHPLRRRILHRLRVHGPATSTTIGEVLGANTGTTSYHLRQLEKHGFIEEVPERSGGRERWWRPAGQRDLRMPPPEALAPQDRPVLAELLRAGHAEDMEILARLPAGYEREPAWARLSRGFAHMTEEGLAAFFEDYVALLHRHAHGPEDAPPGARPLHIRLFSLPADET